jgi:beta-phosphoglucomutase-like phosphatase (HAD superfamily)
MNSTPRYGRHAREKHEEIGVALKPGVVELLDYLDEAELPRAVATSSGHAAVEHQLGGNKIYVALPGHRRRRRLCARQA